MPIQFTAIEVTIETFHDVEIITFAAPPDDDQDFYVMFQRLQPIETLQDKSKEPTLEQLPCNSFPESEENGTITHEPYIEICGQTFGWSGHLKALKLIQNPAIPTHLQLHLAMDETAAAQMENDGIVLIDFVLADTPLQQLRATLADFFPIIKDQLSYSHNRPG